MSSPRTPLPVLVAGAGIGGLAAALALAREGCAVRVLEQATALGEIGAGIQLAPNAFAAFDALGIGEALRARAVYTERMEMRDAIDEVGDLLGRIRPGVPGALRQSVRGHPSRRCPRGAARRGARDGPHRTRDRDPGRARRGRWRRGVTVTDAAGGSAPRLRARRLRRGALGRSRPARRRPGAGLRPRGVPRGRRSRRLPRRPAHQRAGRLGRAELPSRALPAARRRGSSTSSSPSTAATPRPGACARAAPQEVLSYFDGISPRPRQLLSLPRSWKRWATADREPIGRWTHGRTTLLGDAAHPMLQYLAQGACMALEDAVTLGAALRRHAGAIEPALAHYERSRVTRTARVVLMAREMGRIYHAHGVERLVRNDLWKGRTPGPLRRRPRMAVRLARRRLPGRPEAPARGNPGDVPERPRRLRNASAAQSAGVRLRSAPPTPRARSRLRHDPDTLLPPPDDPTCSRPRYPCGHPRQRRARRHDRVAARRHGQRQRLRAHRQPARERAPQRHQPLRRAHGVQGHARAQLPADQPRCRAPRRRRQCAHRQGPHGVPHARHGARRRPLPADARRHRPEQHLSRGRAGARAPGDPARVHRGRGRRAVDRLQAVRREVLRHAPDGPAGDRRAPQHPPLHPRRAPRTTSSASTRAPTWSSASPATSIRRRHPARGRVRVRVAAARQRERRRGAAIPRRHRARSASRAAARPTSCSASRSRR